MKQRIMNHVGFLTALSILVTFFAASVVMYQKYNSYMRQDVKNESQYLRYVLEYMGEEYLTEEVADMTNSRVTIFQKDGSVAFDSKTDAASMENHQNRPEVKAALKAERYCGLGKQQTACLLHFFPVLRLWAFC